MTPTNPTLTDRLAVAPAEAAKLLGIGRTTLYVEIGSGRLPSFRLGVRRLITLDAIRAGIAERHTETQR